MLLLDLFYLNWQIRFVAQVDGVTVTQTERYVQPSGGGSSWIGERKAVIPVVSGDSVYVYNGTAVFVPCK